MGKWKNALQEFWMITCEQNLKKMFCYFTWNQYDIKGYAEENYHLDVFHN